jgi:putative lipoic acid-binding regulatory protein
VSSDPTADPRSGVPAERTLIDYPSAFPIKVMGLNEPGFAEAVADIARRFDPGFDPATLEMRPSKGHKYLGLTVTVTATSREQLDDLYRALTAHALVRVVI